jgi:radical SAM-linked protein
VKDLDRAIYPTSQLVPLVESVHDRGVLEIERGCTQGCRFCHSGMISRPKRSKSNSTIIRLAKDIVKNTGCREISLLSLNVTDFCGGVELLKDLIEVFKEDKIAISFPSMRINKKLLDLAKISSLIKKSGITIALEAGSDRLRRIINKKLIKEEMEELIKDVFEMGYQLIKLYFMIGLPTEKKEDILEIVNLIKKIRSFKKAKKVRVSISSFIPKPHTPFQWLGQEEPSKIREKQKILIENIKDKNVLLSWHQVEQSLLEAALARGDRRLSSVIKRAYEYGCIFDSWSERFNFRLWEKAFRDEGIDLTFYACRSFSLEESLPWDHIDMGIKKSFLKREYEKAFKGLESNDCEKGECLNCGACEKKKEEREKEEIRLEKVRRRKEEIKKDIYRVRFKYHKIDTMSFLSHLDITRLIKQSLIMAELPVIVKGGFNPQIKISFGKALPLGVESICEYFDLFLWKKIDLNKAIKRVNTKLPSGLKILEGEYTSLKEESVFSSFNTGIFKLKVKIKRDIDVIRSEIENKLEKEKIYLERKRREIEIKEMIKSIEIEPVEEEIALINMVLKNSLNPKNIMDILTKDVEIMNIRCVGYFKLIE